MTITASDIAKLRASTGAGMMDCKNAMEEAGGDMEKAAELLRKKGIVKAAKRADKVASEGRVAVYTSEDSKVGVVVEVNSETDFVANSEGFTNFCSAVSEAIAKNNPADASALNEVGLASGVKVGEELSNLALKIGEKIGVRRFVRYESTGAVYSYLHGTKIGVLVEMIGGDKELGIDVAMHIAASNPKYLDRTSVDPTEMNKEKEIYAAQLRQQGKPENIIENILKGKMDKYYGEVCLLEQPFIKDEEQKVEKLAAGKGAKIVRFVRLELGEGMEKKVNDFVAEVTEQLK